MRPSETAMHNRLIESLGGAALADVLAEGRGRDLDETVAAMLSGTGASHSPN
jgi:hypothetical protein